MTAIVTLILVFVGLGCCKKYQLRTGHANASKIDFLAAEFAQIVKAYEFRSDLWFIFSRKKLHQNFMLSLKNASGLGFAQPTTLRRFPASWL